MGLSDIIEKEAKPHGWQYAEKKEKGYRVISASGLSNLLAKPYEWSVNVIDNKRTFFGNEATFLGNVVHKYAELYRSNGLTNDLKLPSVQRDMVLSTSTDIDLKQIYKDYPVMCEALREHYLEVYPTDVVSEKYLEVDLEDYKILVAGSVDEIDYNNKVITDFKTCSKIPTADNMAKYMYQLSCYANLLEKTENLIIETFRIVFIQRPTKTIGARVYIAECKANLDLARDLIRNAINTIVAIYEKPDLRELIFRPNPFDGFTNTDKLNMEAFVSKYMKDFKLITQEESKVKKLQKDIFG